MKHAITLALVAALSGCSIGGASLQPFPAPTESPPEGFARVRLFDVEANGQLDGRLGVGNANGRADGCVLTIEGHLPRGSITISRGDCRFEQLEELP